MGKNKSQGLEGRGREGGRKRKRWRERKGGREEKEKNKTFNGDFTEGQFLWR